mgnify:CR=1 FL=1
MKAISQWLSRFGLLRRSGLGDVGERLAAAYLRRNGYRVLGTNLWSRLGEIDLFAEAPDGRTLVVVEVKSGRDEQIPPEAHVSWSKQRKLVSLASQLVNRYGWTDRPVRFDVVGVVFRADGSNDLRHHVSAFESHV